MEPLSRNKKIGILSLAVLSLTLVGLFFTGNLSFSGLKSNVLNQTCTEQSQKNKLPQYTDFLKKRDQAQKTLNIASGEMAVLNKRISDNNSIIVEKQAQIAEKNTKINELTAYIDKYCKNPRDRNIAQICQTKKQQKRDLGQDVQIIKNSIATLQNTINQLAQNIKNNQRIITEQINLISRYTLFINQYEACEQQLKIKPLLTSPSMSGEAMISGETLVSGEVTLIGKTLISGEVLMSGESCVSGEVRVPLYKFSVAEPYPAKAEVDSISFDVSVDPNTIQLDSWYVTEEYNPSTLYKCSFENSNSSQLTCFSGGAKSVVSGEVRNYILSAKMSSITGTNSIKVYSANITYNGGKTDALNQTTVLKINYAPKPVKTETKYVSQFGGYGEKDGQMKYPNSLAVDAFGNVYVADITTNRIQKFDASGNFLMKFGSFGTGDGQLGHIFNLAIDFSGNIYVSDHANHRIQKFDASGKFLMKFGTNGTGDGQFQNPSGIVFDKEGNLYVTDSINQRIQKFDNQGKFLMKFTVPGFPAQITLDKEGNLYVAEQTKNSIFKFDASGNFLMKFGAWGSGNGQFSYLTGVSLDSAGNIYVTDANNHRFQKFDASGNFLMKFGTNGTGDGQFQDPMGIIIDANNNIYVSDGNNYRVQKFTQVAVCGDEKPSIKSISPISGSVGTIITLSGSGFKNTSTVLIGDNISEVTPVNISPDGHLIAFSFPQDALIKFPADLYSIRVSNVGNVSVASGLASNSILFSIIKKDPSITVLSPNGGETFVLGTPIKIPYEGKGISNTHAFLVPANSPGNGIGSLGVIGSGANSSGTYEWGGKWLLTSSVDGKMIDVLPGDYKIYMVGDVAGESGKIVSDMSDSSFKIVSPIQQTTITPNQVTINSSVNTRLIFAYPSNTTSATLYFTCPTGISMGTSCNTNINVTSNGDWSPMFVNNTSQDQTVVTRYTTVAAGVSAIATANIIVRPAQTSTICTDSDGGNDYFKAGNITFLNVNQQRETYIEYCYADSSNRVEEYYCANNTVYSSTYICPNGCSNAACIASNQDKTITFNKNDALATGTMPNQTIAAGSSAILSANVFSKPGFTFAGWSATATGLVQYTNGASYTIGTASVMLFAKWIPMPPPRSYSVIYNANGATAGVVPAPQTKTHGIDLILANNTGGLVKTGFVFAGWNTAATGTGTNFSVGATYTLNVPVILYAKWIPVPYPVIYNANGATAGVVPAPQNKTHGTNLVLANNTGGLAKTGYVFAGWNTSATGTGTNFSVGAMYTLNVPVILYAKWILVPPINGTCGTAAKTYVLAETGYGTSTFCTTGIRTSIPSFPTPGSTVNWECRGTNGGTNSACVATRISCPPVLPGCTDPATLPRDVNGCMIQTESDFNC